jgi:hypothetical protein
MSGEPLDSIDKLRKTGSLPVLDYLSVDLSYPRRVGMVCFSTHHLIGSRGPVSALACVVSTDAVLGDHNDREGRMNSRFISSSHFGTNDEMAILVDGGQSDSL